MRYILHGAIAAFAIGVIIAGGVFWYRYANRAMPSDAPALVTGPSITDIAAPQETKDAPQDASPGAFPLSEGDATEEDEAFPPRVLYQVPFTSQAPFGEWDDLTFQDGCEEASMIMAMAWVRGTTLSPEGSKRSIEDITRFVTEKFGAFTADTSAEETAQVMRDYYQYAGVDVVHNASIKAIQQLLAKGFLVIAPMNGQKLHNPHFTQPGPLHHMLVIIGYDRTTQEFITNDPGTKEGKSYRYDEEILYQALRDYPTGNDAPLTADDQKTIIVVRKE
ncbi:MAG: C39 family peptidase [Candidatus Moranbacteria bacterium]|nr:C39 family peptidase [Candidatus Moranbacteria bacterium]